MTTEVILEKNNSSFYRIVHPEGGRSVRVRINEPFNTIDSELITLIYRVRHLQVRDRTLSMPGYYFDVASVSDKGILSTNNSCAEILRFLKDKQLVSDTQLLGVIANIRVPG